MSQNKTTWIDLTDIAVWSGHHTGIQRVVYNIAKYYSKESNTKYFVFDSSSKIFKLASFDQIEHQIQASSVVQQASEYSPTPDKIKVMAYKLYTMSPPWLKDKMTTPANKARIRKVYKTVHSTINRQPKQKIQVEAGNEKITFDKGDAVLIMGKVWDYFPDYIETLRREKLESGFRVYQVVYDLMPVFFPHLFGQPLIAPYTKHMFEVGSISDGLLAISKSTKKDMQKFCQELNIPEPPIEVIRLGDDFIEAEAVKPNIEGINANNFLLCVGTIEVRKNHQLMYLAYKEADRRGIAMPHLVIMGSTGWYTSDVLYAFMNDPVTKDKVHVLNNVNDQELKWLYQNCIFTVYPSVYEGWGLPVAESLAYGKMCLTSNISSMPEIAGDLLEYFSPYDSGQCLELISKYLNPTTLSKKEKEIRQSYKPTAWSQTYGQVRKLINSSQD